MGGREGCIYGVALFGIRRGLRLEGSGLCKGF